jgi:hypothetical protein
MGMSLKRSSPQRAPLSDDQRRELLIAEEAQRHLDELAQVEREAAGLGAGESVEDLVARELAGKIDPKSKEFRGIRLTPSTPRPRRR